MYHRIIGNYYGICAHEYYGIVDTVGLEYSNPQTDKQWWSRFFNRIFQWRLDCWQLCQCYLLYHRIIGNYYGICAHEYYGIVDTVGLEYSNPQTDKQWWSRFFNRIFQWRLDCWQLCQCYLLYHRIIGNYYGICAHEYYGIVDTVGLEYSNPQTDKQWWSQFFNRIFQWRLDCWQLCQCYLLYHRIIGNYYGICAHEYYGIVDTVGLEYSNPQTDKQWWSRFFNRIFQWR